MAIKYNGMASLNGIIFESDGYFVKGIKGKNNTIKIKGKKLPTFFGIWPAAKKVPGLRYVAFFIDALVIRPIYLLDWSQLVLLAIIFVTPTALNFGLSEILYLIYGVNGPFPQFLNWTYPAIIWVATLATSFTLFRITKVATYHAAEHKVGNYYDTIAKKGVNVKTILKEDLLNITEAQNSNRIHPRCGTNIFIPIAIIVTLLAPLNLPFYAYLLSIGIGIEVVVRIMEQNNIFGKTLLKIGSSLQRITTKECNVEDTELSLQTFKTMLIMKSQKIKTVSKTIKI